MLVADIRAGFGGGTLVRRKRVIVVVGGLVAALSVGLPKSAPFTAGTLNLTIDLGVESPPESCSPEVSGATQCREERRDNGTASGLGNVSESYFWVLGMGPPTSPSGDVGFDVTPPILSVTTAKSVRARKGAKSVRVTYKVTARDDV